MASSLRSLIDILFEKTRILPYEANPHHAQYRDTLVEQRVKAIDFS